MLISRYVKIEKPKTHKMIFKNEFKFFGLNFFQKKRRKSILPYKSFHAKSIFLKKKINKKMKTKIFKNKSK